MSNTFNLSTLENNLKWMNRPMEEKIKIAYSWIGPRGPIWNTELPNVLSFASVAEGSSTSSHKFWADDMWNRLFGPRKHIFEMYPAISIELNDPRPFIFPFSLTWRVEFNNYFCGNTGIIEFAHMPMHLMPMIRNGNGYILIDHSVEAFTNDGHLHSLHGYFGNIHRVPLNKIIYLTGTMNTEVLYDEYCRKYNIPDLPQNRLKIISYPSSHQIFASNPNVINNEPDYDINRIPPKLFLMWNRRFRRHRIELALVLEKNNVVERSFVSFNSVDLERPTTTFETAIDMRNLLARDPRLGLTEEIVQRFKNRLPLVLDGETDVNKMCEDYNRQTKDYYKDSLVSIVTETNWEQPEVTLTEKSFKPIKEKHPFIIAGVPGSLKALKKMGFRTFDEFWSEEYDDVQCPIVRMQKLNQVIENISAWSESDILNFRRRVKPILDHNWKQLLKSSSEVCVNDIIAHMEKYKV